jgi:hypothetical protein
MWGTLAADAKGHDGNGHTSSNSGADLAIRPVPIERRITAHGWLHSLSTQQSTSVDEREWVFHVH